jgi:hypothetical protein
MTKHPTKINLPHQNNFTKMLSLTVKVLGITKLRCNLVILVILDHSHAFRVIIPEVVLI